MVSVIPYDVEIQRELTSLRIEEWLRSGLFHFRWWFLLALFFVSIIAWWKLVDKKRLHEISLCTALIIIITLVLDELGEELTLWDYPIDIIPVFPPLTAIDLASLPIIYSLIYQYFGTWKSFLWATFIMATVFCFIFEPILVWGGFYQLLSWKYYYGFPIYSGMAIFIRFVVIKTLAYTEKFKKAQAQQNIQARKNI
jgi:hypothetical protein